MALGKTAKSYGAGIPDYGVIRLTLNSTETLWAVHYIKYNYKALQLLFFFSLKLVLDVDGFLSCSILL